MDICDEFDAPLPDRRSSAEDIRRQSQALEAVSLPLRLLDVIPGMFLLLNENRQIVFVNEVFMEVFGIGNRHEVYGLRPGEALKCVYSDKNPDGCGTSGFCTQCGGNISIRASLAGTAKARECSLLRKNAKGEAETLDLLVWGAPFSLDGEDFSAFSLVDISSERRRRALERLFFHDILNIAGGIQTYTEFLGTTGACAGKHELSVINRYAQKLVEEIQTQRELVMAENNELVANIMEFDLHDFLMDTVKMYREHETARDRVIAIDPEVTGVSMMSDPALLGRVIGNMLKNALEASASGETVTVYGDIDGDSVEFAVHNGGVISPDARKNIFKRSFSTKGQGRGLGTYGMKLIGERYLGGSVTFTSTDEAGTTFRIRLPRNLEPRKHKPVPSSAIPR